MLAVQQHARNIHRRLRNPPNAVEDHGIDLKRRKVIPIAEITAPAKAEFVLPYRIDTLIPVYSLLYRLPEPDPNKYLEISKIQRTVCRYFKITMTDIRSARRTPQVCVPRQIAMYLAKTLTGRSLPHIGRMFGGKDHTTVLHAVRKIEKQRHEDQELNGKLKHLESMLVAFPQHEDAPCSSAPTTAA